MDNLSFDKFRTKEDDVRYFSEQIEEIDEKKMKSLDKTGRNVALLPFPEELEHEAGVRRRGCENGSSCFIKNLKLTGFRKLEDLKILSLFDYLGCDTYKHDGDEFRRKFKEAMGSGFLGAVDLQIVVGGGNHIAEFYFNQIEDQAGYTLFKISPKIGNTDLKDSKSVNNFNFMNSLCSQNKELGILHSSVLPYLTTRDDYAKAASLGQKVEFFEESHAPDFEEKVKECLKDGRKLVVLLDCEALSAEFFHGISQPNIDGLNFKGLLNLAKMISSYIDSIDALLISNFNPTIEKSRSVSFLNTFVYKILEGVAKHE